MAKNEAIVIGNCGEQVPMICSGGKITFTCLHQVKNHRESYCMEKGEVEFEGKLFEYVMRWRQKPSNAKSNIIRN